MLPKLAINEVYCVTIAMVDRSMAIYVPYYNGTMVEGFYMIYKAKGHYVEC